MDEFKRTRVYLIMGLAFVLLLTHLPIVYTAFYHNLTGAPRAGNGAIDLSDQSLDESGKIILDGDWAFFWNRLIASEPQEGDKPDFLIKVPDYWSKYEIGGGLLPANGFASYQLTVQGLDYPRNVTVYIPDFGSAYRVFIDGELTAESGVISKDNSKVFTVPKAELYPVLLSAGEPHEIIIEVATTRFSGLYMAPILKDYDGAIQANNDRTGIRFILFGTVIFSFLALMILYMMSFRKGMRSIWLPAMGLFVVLRIMLTTEFYSFWQGSLFFNLSYERTNELMFFSTFVLKFLLIFLIQEQFGSPFSRREKIAFILYYSALFLVYLLVPQAVYNRHLTIIVPVLSFALEFYAFFKLYVGWHQLKKYGMLIYCGVLLAISGLIVDCYYINGNIYLNMSLAMLSLLSVYLMIITLVYALRISEIQKEFLVSASTLAMARNQITMQKEYYDILNGQMNEIRAIKHDMRHFVNVTQQLFAEKRYEEVSRFLNEYGNKTETDPLLVFCENVVANAILSYYFLKARDAGIAFQCTCSIRKQLAVSDTDLCVVLSNALENAIEACGRTESPTERFLSVDVRNMNGQLLIKIENAFNGALKISEEEYVSTKEGEFHGIGMRNIKKVVESYDGFLKTEYNGRMFTFLVAFPNPPGIDTI
ncbi:MAG: hypothetical protein PWQ12_958 [Clostridiales bacterium]|nr:hypothetical protein [Clostridiales bacterium]